MSCTEMCFVVPIVLQINEDMMMIHCLTAYVLYLECGSRLVRALAL